jgi:hypothetical protein
MKSLSASISASLSNGPVLTDLWFPENLDAMPVVENRREMAIYSQTWKISRTIQSFQGVIGASKILYTH